jgi:hypothetical protein
MIVSKDLVRKNDLTTADRERDASMATEADLAFGALAEQMLFGAHRQSQPAGPPRVILGLDCTSSMGEFIPARKITTEGGTNLTKALFANAPGVEVQLVYFRGDELKASDDWYTSADALARAIVSIEHQSGWTQHCRLLRHAVAQAEKQAIQSLVIVSDAFEERTPLRPQGDDLVAARVHAARLRDLGVKIVAGYKGTIKGGCPLNRAGVSAEQAFRDITEENGGYCFLFHSADLTQRFREIASQATLAAKGDAVGARALLEHLQIIPFDMNVVGERVGNAKCGSIND